MNKLIRHIIVLAAAGVALAGCGKNELIGVEHTPTDEIRFNNGYIDNLTRSTSLLSEHMNTMGVWGWYTPQGKQEECLFKDQCVEFDRESGKWTYTPKKYWDKNCTYLFNAYAPHASESDGAKVTIDRSTRHFSISGITLKGDNTMEGLRQEAPLGRFINVSDDDWMIDRKGQDILEANGREVEFNMQHILSKICVVAHLDEFVGTITIDSLKIGPFISKADFNQNADAENEWTLDSTATRYYASSEKNLTVDKPMCVLESLIFPQESASDQKLEIHYSINGAAFLYTHSLKAIFENRFMTAHNYVITLTIGPEIIKFDGSAVQWDDNEIHRYIQ